MTALPVYLFPLDRDLLSLELPDCFSQLAAGDLTCLHWAATALTRLQAITGTIPRVYGKGTAAVQVLGRQLAWFHIVPSTSCRVCSGVGVADPAGP